MFLSYLYCTHLIGSIIHACCILQLEGVGIEVKQILPCGVVKRHRHSDSAGTASTNSSRSHPNATREDRLASSNTQRARSQFLENHLAKLFEQKMEIFTKVEYTQASCSKSHGNDLFVKGQGHPFFFV